MNKKNRLEYVVVQCFTERGWVDAFAARDEVDALMWIENAKSDVKYRVVDRVDTW